MTFNEIINSLSALGTGPDAFNERIRLEGEAITFLLEAGEASSREAAREIVRTAEVRAKEEARRKRDEAARGEIAAAEAALGDGAFVATVEDGLKGPILRPTCDASAWRAGTRTSDNRRGDRIIPAKGCRLPVGTRVYAVRDREIARGVVVCRVQAARP